MWGKTKTGGVLLCLLLAISGCQKVRSEVLPISERSDAAQMSFFTVEEVTELKDSAAEMAASHPDLSYQDYTVDGIPILQVQPKDADGTQKLVVFLHGVTSEKENEAWILTLFAMAGYTAVSFDMPGHGERTDGAYMFLDVISQGMKDLDTVLLYCRNALGLDIDHYALGGFSAGGICAYDYAINGTYQPDILVAVSAVCDWSELEKSELLDQCYEHGQFVTAVKTHEEVLEELDQGNPFPNLMHIVDIPVIIAHGTADPTIGWQAAQIVYDQLKALGSTQAELYLYPGIGHAFSADFFTVMIKSIERALPRND